jgi:hypothetical protein
MEIVDGRGVANTRIDDICAQADHLGLRRTAAPPRRSLANEWTRHVRLYLQRGVGGGRTRAIRSCALSPSRVSDRRGRPASL